MLIFAGLYFLSPKSTATTQMPGTVVTNTVFVTFTNEIVREVPKEVRIPAEIPQEYIDAMRVYQNITNATYADSSQALFGMKEIKVICTVDEALKKVISEDEVKAKFELTLRRNGVPIDPASFNMVQFRMTGFFNEATGLYCYSFMCYVNEQNVIWRSGQFHGITTIVWFKGGSYGTVGKSQASSGLLPEVEKCAEVFANDFLSANPKAHN